MRNCSIFLIEFDIVLFSKFVNDLLLQSFIQQDNIILQEFNYLNNLKKIKRGFQLIYRSNIGNFCSLD